MVQTDKLLKVTANLLGRESAIPGFGLLLDPERLLAGLSGQLDINKVEDIKLNYLRYKPGMNCLARYELTTQGQNIKAYAKAHGEDAVNKMGKSMERPVIDGALGPGRAVIGDQQVIFSTFPNDAKLASLQCLSNSSYRQRLLSRVFGPDSEWQDSSFGQALNYKPERRYVARLTRADGESALVKFYSRSGYAKARAISRKLNRNRHSFYPETIGRSKKHSVVAYHWQPGTTLRQLSTDGKLTTSDLVATAESLAEFHASGRQGLSFVGLDEQIRRLDALSEQLVFLLPHLHKRAKSVVHKLAQWLGARVAVIQAVHGDFYDKQAIMNNGRISLIDLDGAHLGNPLLDLGSYMAHLERLAVNHGISPADVNAQKDALVGAYEQMTGSTCSEQLDKYTALGLFVLIHHPFRDWAQDWPQQTEHLLKRVEDLYAA